MLRLAVAFMSIIPATSALAGAPAAGQAAPGKYSGYSWPVAPGCTQRVATYPNFANKVRLRPDGTKRAHLGVDLIPPATDYRIYVAKDGVVVVNSPASGTGWGNYVVVKHDDGLSTLYGHLVAPSKLRVKRVVSKGDLVGIAGQTETFFVHTHFEVHLKESSDDWTRGRLDPVSVVGPLDACTNSAAPVARAAKR